MDFLKQKRFLSVENCTKYGKNKTKITNIGYVLKYNFLNCGQVKKVLVFYLIFVAYLPMQFPFSLGCKFYKFYLCSLFLIPKFLKIDAFLTVKDHKNNFPIKVECRTIYPGKNALGKISKNILEKIVLQIR